jgi:hypothetical protein
MEVIQGNNNLDLLQYWIYTIYAKSYIIQVYYVA